MRIKTKKPDTAPQSDPYKVHELKIHPKYYREVSEGNKNFEIRKNDRGFKVGDEIKLMEFADGYYTHAKNIWGKITYITDYEQKPEMVVLGVKWSLDTEY